MIWYLLIVIFSLFLSLTLPGVIRRLFSKTRLIAGPAIPSIGGISICISLILACFLFLGPRIISQPKLIGLLLSGSVMLVFGVIDDLKELSVAPKLITQCIAIGILIAFGISLKLPHIGPFFNLIITLLWVLGINNALNHLDVADGVAASVAVTSCLAFFVLTAFTGQIVLGVICLILAGAILGFLKYNLPPAKIYLGNAGSHFLGFMLAAIALNIDYSLFGQNIAFLSPVIILGLLILDTAFLSFIRLKKGISPMSKSDDHIALQMLKQGFSRHRILAMAVSLNLVFCIGGVLLAIF